MSIPTTLKAEIETVLGVELSLGSVVGGGCINNASRVRLDDGREALVKWRGHTPPGMFTAEERGLALLRSANALRIPDVYAAGEPEAGRPGYIVMEWLGQGRTSRTVEETLGHGLAALHRVTGPNYGLDHDNYCGSTPQPNSPALDWVTFFREKRLGFQIELAAKNGYFDSTRRQQAERLLTQLDELLPADPGASLLHGDLWGGNWLTAAGDEPALIDPAVYYGHREAELAFTELFGGFPRTFYDAYQAAWPLDPGYRQRKDLYNLYHLLNHLNLFGTGYLSQVTSVISRYTR